MKFQRFIGIDYSGAAEPDKVLPGLAVYEAEGKNVRKVGGRWSRTSIAEYLIASCTQDAARTLVGIDHGFSFPDIYYKNRGLPDWRSFIDDFVSRWPLLSERRVDDALAADPPQEKQSGPESLRLCEKWIPGPSSVFKLIGQGSVGKSTFSGLAQLQRILQVRDLHVWPFDGWQATEGRHVICEIYPSLFKRRYERLAGDSEHEWDASAVVRWMQDMQSREMLEAYFRPPLRPEEKALALREGWILGVR